MMQYFFTVSHSVARKLCNWSVAKLVSTSEYSVPCSPMVLTLLTFTSVPWVMGYGMPMNSAWFQQDDARPHTNHVVLSHLHDVLEERVLSNRYPTEFDEGFSWPSTSPDLKSLPIIFVGYLKDRMYQKNLHTISELNTAIQWELHFYRNSNQHSEWFYSASP